MGRSSIARFELPLLHDHHSHASLYSAFASCPDLSGMKPEAALAYLRAMPSDRLSVARGWRTNELPLDAALLAELPPVLLVNFSLHGFAISDAGLPFVQETIPDVAENRDDRAWREANVPRLFAAYCGLSGVSIKKLDDFMEGLAKLGIGSTEDMAVPSAAVLGLMRPSGRAASLSYWVGPAVYQNLSAGERDACSGVKLFLDGSIGARSAAIRGAWTGGGQGILTYRDDELYAELARIAGWKAGLAVHAIGDLAIDQVLAALERLASEGLGFPLARLEHVQFIDESQARRARELGAILSMQPNFSVDSLDYADRLPAGHLRRNNPFRMLIDRAGFVPGVDLLFGSDGMPHGIAHPASHSLFPPHPVQRLSLPELIAGYGPARGVSGSVSLEVDAEARAVRVTDTSIRA